MQTSQALQLIHLIPEGWGSHEVKISLGDPVILCSDKAKQSKDDVFAV